MAPTLNPYQAPRSEDPPQEPLESRSPGEIREAHLFHETALRDLGAIVGAVGLVLILAGAFLLARAPTPVWIGVVAAGSGGAVLLTAMALSQLRPDSRWPALGTAVLGLFAFPILTPLSAYLLYLVASRQGRYVLSPAYGSVMEATGPRRSGLATFVFTVMLLLTAGVGAVVFWLAKNNWPP